MYRIFIFFACLLLSPGALAGLVVLGNGDQLQGSLIRIESEVVVWESASLGELRLPKSAIHSLESAQPMKIQGKEVPCLLDRVEDQLATFNCVDGDRRTFSLLALRDIIRYQGGGASQRVYAGKLRASGLKHTGNLETEYWEVLFN